MVNSYILQKIKTLIMNCVVYYKESSTDKFFSQALVKVSDISSDSAICRYFSRDEKISDLWHDSLFFNWIQRLIDFFVLYFRKTYAVVHAFAKNSFSIKVYRYLRDKLLDYYTNRIFYIALVGIMAILSIFISPVKVVAMFLGFILLIITLFKFELGLSIFLFGIFIIPHQYWNNIYSIGGTIFFMSIYIIKVASDKKYSLNIKALDFMFLVFALMIILSTITSITPPESIKTMLFYITALLLVALLANCINDKKNLNYILMGLFAAVLITSFYAVYQGIVGVEVDLALTDVQLNQGMPGRVYSTLENPNNYAEFLILIVPFCAAYILNLKNRFMQIVLGGIIIIPIIALALTYSRAGYVAFAIAVFVFIALKNWKLVPFGIILGIIAIPFLPRSIIQRIMTITNFKDSSISYRFYIWEGALDMLKDYWATGIGVGPEPFSRLSPNYMNSVVTKAAHSHMLFMEIWIEMGIIAMISFLWHIMRIVKKSFKAIYSKKDRDLNNILVAGIAALAGISFMGFVEYVWFYPRIMLTFWIVLGIMAVALKLSIKDDPV